MASNVKPVENSSQRAFVAAEGKVAGTETVVDKGNLSNLQSWSSQTDTKCGSEETEENSEVCSTVTSSNFDARLLTLSKVYVKSNSAGTENYVDIFYDGKRMVIQVDNVRSSGVIKTRFNTMFMTVHVPETELSRIEAEIFKKLYERRTEFALPGQSGQLKRLKSMTYDMFFAQCKPLVEKDEYGETTRHRVMATVPSQKVGKDGDPVLDSTKFSYMDKRYVECPVLLNNKAFLKECAFSVDRIVYRRNEFISKKTWALAVTDEFAPSKVFTSGMLKRKREEDFTADVNGGLKYQK